MKPELLNITKFDHPTITAGPFEYYLCSPKHPMPANRPFKSKWIHVNAAQIEQKDYTEIIQCPDCGHQWEVELPE